MPSLRTDEASVNALYKAVLMGDRPAIERLLAEGVDPNGLATSSNGHAPLSMIDVHDGHGPWMVARFVAAGVDLNRCDRLNNGVLFHAIRLHNASLRPESRTVLATVHALLDAGADPHQLGNTQATGDGYSRRRVRPLDQAIVKAHPALVDLLLEFGADPLGTTARHGGTALHFATEGHHPNLETIVHRLVTLGADEHARDAQGTTPLRQAQGTVAQALHRALDERRVNHELRVLADLAQDLGTEAVRPRVRL